MAGMAGYSRLRGLANTGSTARPSMAKTGQKGEAVLIEADNVNINDSGVVRRRPGFHKIHGGSVHSLYANGQMCLFREGRALKALQEDYSVRTLRNDIAGSLPMSYLTLNGLVYYGDGAVCAVVDKGRSRSWGLEVPEPPLVSAIQEGELPAGRYLAALTTVRRDGQESGASSLTAVDLPTRGGLAIGYQVPEDPDVEYIRIYLSSAEGDTLYLAVSNSIDRKRREATVTCQGKAAGPGLALAVRAVGPPPALKHLTWYRGRIYGARHDAIHYCLPYSYELFDPAYGWIPCGSPVTLLEAMEDGIYVGTDREVIFLQGTRPEEFRRIPCLPCGAVPGTAARDGREGEAEGSGSGHVLYFESRRGKCKALGSGKVILLTEDTYAYACGASGAGIILHRDGMALYLTVLQGPFQPPFNRYERAALGSFETPGLLVSGQGGVP